MISGMPRWRAMAAARWEILPPISPLLPPKVP
jgi:hypothetical protein